MRTPLLLLPVLLAAPLLAQEPRARFHVGLAGGLGQIDYRDRGTWFSSATPQLSGDRGARYGRLEFEATSRRGFGGGLRYEGFRSENDLFQKEGYAPTRATVNSLFAHFSYRLEDHRFAMPVRVGLLLNGMTLKDRTTGDQRKYGSIGPYFEVAPEVVALHSGHFDWSFYTQLGVGGGATGVDITGDSNNYYSTTGFLGVEVGTRFHISRFELTVAYIGRWQSMDESDIRNGRVVRGNDVSFQGAFIGMGFNF